MVNYLGPAIFVRRDARGIWYRHCFWCANRVSRPTNGPRNWLDRTEIDYGGLSPGGPARPWDVGRWWGEVLNGALAHADWHRQALRGEMQAHWERRKRSAGQRGRRALYQNEVQVIRYD